MLEALGVFDTQDDYSKYKDIITKSLNDFDLERIAENVGKYYKETGLPEIDWSAFSTWFFINNPLVTAEKRTLFEGIFKQLEDLDTSLKSSLIDACLKRYHAERIAFLAMEVAEARKTDLAPVQTELDSYTVNSGKANDMSVDVCTNDLDDLLTTVSHGSGLNWRLNALNESLGELHKGRMCLFAARPEVGKTTLLASECTFMAQQLPPEKKVLYFTNEEDRESVNIRLWCSLLGVDLATLKANRLHFIAEHDKLLHGDRNKIIVIGKWDMSVHDIEYWLKNTDVGLIVIDQLRKVRGFDEIKGGIQRLERVFQTAREWSKEYAPVLTVSQLDAEAENEQFPSMSRLYESKTAVQGECDVIVNIGQVDGSVPEHARWLNVVKNKLPTPMVASLRHGKHEVLIDPEIARYT